jgi:hypothetical protein
MVDPFFINPFFMDYVLPFVLVFTLIFAILEKTKILGDGKKQISAIVGLVIGLMFIAFPFAKNIVVFLMPFLAVSVVILLVFMLLYGFIVGKKDGDVLGKWWKVAFGAILSVAMISVLLMATGYWPLVYSFLFETTTGNQIWINGFLVVVIVGVIIAVIQGEKK